MKRGGVVSGDNSHLMIDDKPFYRHKHQCTHTSSDGHSMKRVTRTLSKRVTRTLSKRATRTRVEAEEEEEEEEHRLSVHNHAG